MGSSVTRRLSRATLVVTALGAAALGVVFAACTDLPDWNAQGCGNGVVNFHEDCDGNVAADGGAVGFRCGAPGTPEQCRFTCGDTTGDGSGAPAKACPPGYACGVDKICRAPTGAFEAEEETLPRSRSAMVFADADGDGRAELFSKDRFFTDVDYFGPTGHVTATLQFAAHVAPAVGDITGDGRADFTFSAGQKGLVVMRGQSDQSFLPTAYPVISRPGRVVSAFTVRGAPGAPSDTEIMITGSAMMAVTNKNVAMQLLQDNLFPGDPSDLLPVVVGDLDERTSAPCEEFVVANATTHTFATVTLANGCTPPAGGAPSATFKLDTMGTVRSFFLADMNKDGHLDLVIALAKRAMTPQLSEIRVAFGKGDGTFTQPEPPFYAPGNNVRQLLAVSDLDRNGYPDFVVWTAASGDPGSTDGGANPASGISILYNHADLSSPSETQPIDTLPPVEPMQQQSTSVNVEAKIADLNGDMFPDLLVASSLEPGVTYFLNQGSKRFNPFQVSTENPPRHLTIGDFDGDMHPDLAFVDASTATSTDEVLSVAFGQASGVLEPTVSIGEIPVTTFLTAGRAMIPSITPRTSSDILAVSELPDGDVKTSQITIFGASGDRQLLAPYIGTMAAAASELPTPISMYASAIGHFDEKDTDVAIIADSTDTMYPFQLLRLHANTDGEFASSESLPLPRPRAREGMESSASTYDWRSARLLKWSHGKLDKLIALVPLQGAATGMGMSDVFDIIVYETDDKTGFKEETWTRISGERLDANTWPCVANLRPSAGKLVGAGDLALFTTSTAGSGMTGANGNQEARHVLLFWSGADGLDLRKHDVLELDAATIHGFVSTCEGDAGARKDFETLRGFACVEATASGASDADGGTGIDDDGTRELALVSNKRWYIVKYRNGGWNLERSAESCTEGGSAIGVGDVTGDGVEDLVIASDAKTNTTRVYQGIPVIP
jgi:FG-GAP-like repeat/FG-GAP repeat